MSNTTTTKVYILLSEVSGSYFDELDLPNQIIGVYKNKEDALKQFNETIKFYRESSKDGESGNYDENIEDDTYEAFDYDLDFYVYLVIKETEVK